MGDLLIRNMDDGLKRQLRDAAQRHGRSMSEEAVLQIRKALATTKEQLRKPGEVLRSAIGGAYLDEETIAAMEAFRREPAREPPDLE